jgi:hypothetical protein
MLAFAIVKDMHRHVNAEDLERYSMGTSSRDATALIEEHLLICEGCRDRFREIDDYRLAMRTASEQLWREQKAAQGRQWRVPAWFPALAAVACGILLVAATLRFVRQPGPVVGVTLTALRGNGAGSSAPAGRAFMLHPDLSGLVEASSYRLEIVDRTGHTVRQSTLARAQNGVKVPGLGAGLYFVRVYLPAGELLREYGLEIQ